MGLVGGGVCSFAAVPELSFAAFRHLTPEWVIDGSCVLRKTGNGTRKRPPLVLRITWQVANTADAELAALV